ncbi:hypothetical protein Tco_0994569 [Tanacetum coccineum]
MWNSIQNGPYARPMIPNPDDTKKQILEPLSKMTTANKSQYIADVKVMNYLLQAIPNDIYNLVDACKNAKEIWERIKRLMFGSDVTSHVRHSRLMDEFDKFAAKEGESLESMYESVNQHQVSQLFATRVEQICHHASKAKKATKNHDPLALLVHSNASSSQSHANSSLPQPYYVTHPSSVVDYEDEYQGELQGDSQKDKLITAMMMVELTYKPRMQVMVKMVTRMQGNITEIKHLMQELGMTKAIRLFIVFHEPSLLRERQMFSVITAMRKATMPVIVRDQEFMMQKETMEELTAAVMLMAQIQSADGNAKIVPSYDAKAVIERMLEAYDWQSSTAKKLR